MEKGRKEVVRKKKKLDSEVPEVACNKDSLS